MKFNKKFVDLAERVVITFVGAFVTLFVTTILASGSLHSVADLDVLDKAAVAGIAASAPLIVGLVGFNVGDRSTASIVKLPVEQDVPAEPEVPTEQN